MSNDYNLIFEEAEVKEQIQNRVFQSAIQYIESYSKEHGKEQTIEMLKQAVENLDIVLQLLDKEKSFNQLKVLGQVLTPAMLVNTLTTIFAINLTLFELFIL